MKRYTLFLVALVLFVAVATRRPDEKTAPTEPQMQSSPVISESIAVSQPTTQAAETSAPTEPSDPEDEGLEPVVAAFRRMARASWTSPLKSEFGEITGSRRFASSRSSGARAHAGVDFVAPHGTNVYAMTDGTVQRVAGFYQNTMAVEILNADGSILRYCEIDPIVQTGDYVKQGQKIGTILRADSGTEMLHLEVYTGEATGALTQSDNRDHPYVDSQLVYQRRWDLLDPTFLTELPCWSEEDNS